MPYVDLISGDDYATLWYTTNAPFQNVGGLDPQKPTVLLLHPYTLDAEWLMSKIDHPRIQEGYNLVAFDMRCSGKTEHRPSGRHDNWVDAADLAFAHHALRLPPVHVFAEETFAVPAAQRLAILFPDIVLSLTLSCVPPPTALKWVFDSLDEMMQSWCFAEDLESFEHVAGNFWDMHLGKQELDVDLKDELVAILELAFPPNRRARVAELIHVHTLNRAALTAQELACITQPVLIVQGDRGVTNPVKYAEELAQSLVNAQDGAKLYTVKGAISFLTVLPSTRTLLWNVFHRFISRLPPPLPPPSPSSPNAPFPSLRDYSRAALKKLAKLSGEHGIADRDPQSPMSFSRLPEDIVKAQIDTIRLYQHDMKNAFSPLRPDGRPIRKYSERFGGHWFHGESNGMSYAGSGGTVLSSVQHRLLGDTGIGLSPLATTSVHSGTSSSASSPAVRPKPLAAGPSGSGGKEKEKEKDREKDRDRDKHVRAASLAKSSMEPSALETPVSGELVEAARVRRAAVPFGNAQGAAAVEKVLVKGSGVRSVIKSTLVGFPSGSVFL